MGDTKSLENKEAIEKIIELAKDKICLFCTHENGKLVTRPMSTQAIDPDGSFWFFSPKDSNKNRQLNTDEDVYLMYMETGKQHYLSLHGHAEEVDDKGKIKELWTPIAKAWFPGGVDDPEISLLKFTPAEGHYWDTKNGRLVTLIKIAISAVTGEKSYGSVEGNLAV